MRCDTNNQANIPLEVSQVDSCERLVHPIQTSNRRTSKSHKIKNLPSSMTANMDFTMSIYTNSTVAGNRDQRKLYTDIPVPFAAIHGMQTRGSDDCNVMSICSENMEDICIKDTESWKKGNEFRQMPSIMSFVGSIFPRNMSRPLLIATLAAATLQFLVGYNVVILNNPEKYVFPDHTLRSWSLAVAALAIGAPIVAGMGSQLSDGKGRRYTLISAAVMFLVGGTIQTFAPNLNVLTTARFIVGLASGVATVVVPVFLGELAPAHLRGTIGTVNQFAFVIGILVAFLVSFGLATETGWRYLFSVTILVSIFQLVMMIQVPESPRWLIQRDPNNPDAHLILQSLREKCKPKQLQQELAGYKAASLASDQSQKSDSSLIDELISQPSNRYLFCCVIFLHSAQQLSGISAVFYYSTSLLEGIIENPLVGTSLVGTVNVLSTYLALLLMDKCNRKSLLLWSFGGMLLACVSLVLAHVGIFSDAVGIIALNVYVAAYEIGVGPIPWLVIAEVFETKYVAVIMSVCSQLSWIVNFVVSLIFPTLNNVLGGYTFVPFKAILFLSLLFTWYVLPETQGKTVSQVTDEVEKKISAESSSQDDDYRSWETMA